MTFFCFSFLSDDIFNVLFYCIMGFVSILKTTDSACIGRGYLEANTDNISGLINAVQFYSGKSLPNFLFYYKGILCYLNFAIILHQILFHIMSKEFLLSIFRFIFNYKISEGLAASYGRTDVGLQILTDFKKISRIIAVVF
jgi:hypothetical protein